MGFPILERKKMAEEEKVEEEKVEEELDIWVPIRPVFGPDHRRYEPGDGRSLPWRGSPGTSWKKMNVAADAGEVSPEDVRDTQIKEALKKLNRDKDDHWTKSGLPAMEAVEKYANMQLTRDEVTAAWPGFKRDADMIPLSQAKSSFVPE
jgi:hypothetical protein